MMDDPDNALNYLISLWKGNVYTKSLSFNDLGWCKEVHACPPIEKPTDVSF